MDYCISRFITIAPKQAKYLIEKYNPVLLSSNRNYNLFKYLKIDKKYYHSIMYRTLTIPWTYEQSFFDDYLTEAEFIDYEVFKLSKKIVNNKFIKNIKNSNKKICKYLDLKNMKFLPKPIEIKNVNYDINIDLSVY